MEIGYKNTMQYLIQLKDQQSVQHHLIEAGSMKDAENKMRQEASGYNQAIVVTSIKSNGELGDAGHGQLPNEDFDIQQVISNLKGEDKE